MEKNVQMIYVSPNIYVEQGEDWTFDMLMEMPDNEALTFARNSNECEVFSLDGFVAAFNNEQISDMGYIRLIK